MIICKKLNQKETICSLQEWFDKCPPQGNRKQWVDGRSAKETAKHWIYTCPQSFSNLLQCFKLHYKLCSPEYVSRFDNLQGNSRNHDLIITAEYPSGENVLISVESKVDEPFDKSIAAYLAEIQHKKVKGTPTKADIRIKYLKQALFTSIADSHFSKLKYQLLSAVAGLLSEARKQQAVSAVLVIQTFISQQMVSAKHRENQKDLDFFIEVISKGRFKIIHDGGLLGPFRVPGNKFIPNDVDLWIGKYSIVL